MSAFGLQCQIEDQEYCSRRTINLILECVITCNFFAVWAMSGGEVKQAPAYGLGGHLEMSRAPSVEPQEILCSHHLMATRDTTECKTCNFVKLAAC